MGNQWFQFKQFRINQDKTAMKVGTDGVLLGAWTSIPDIGRVLDIGTGTGLIALMVAQRNLKVKITAIDIEPDAYKQAIENVEESKFSDSIEVICESLSNYTLHDNEKFELVVCNPPFYNTLNPGNDRKRAIARHSESLELNELISIAAKILSSTGIMSLILPSEQLDLLEKLIFENGLHLHRLTYVKPTPVKDAHRVLVQIGFKQMPIDISTLVIEEFGRHQYSDEFKSFVAPFYLKI